GIIVPFRTSNSSKAYKSVWTPEGSPLIVLTQQLKQALEQIIDEPVEIAMRYGSYKPQEAYDALLARSPEIEEVIVVPLYPHFAMSSYETAAEYAKLAYKKGKYKFKLKVVAPFYDNPLYIDALAESIKPFLAEEFDHILFSYHGIPARHIHLNDPEALKICLASPGGCAPGSDGYESCYKRQVFVTTDLVMKQLNIPEEKYSIAFQSRLGKGWLEPFTDQTLKAMPEKGIKKLLVLCPAFISDCLETLEEIAEEGKKEFLSAGGETYKMIPCLNVHPKWVETLKVLLNGDYLAD
ncbi:MAG TPA: ferrochelatase, partial [Parasegetibacter sp.]